MAQGGRHGGVRYEPGTRRLLMDAIDALRGWPGGRHEQPEPVTPPDGEGSAARVAAALTAQSDLNPAWTHAVVFRTTRPLRMGINSGRDFDLFCGGWLAEKRLLEPQSPEFRDPELWERDSAHGWHRAI